MRLIVRHLNGTAAIGFRDGTLHGAGHLVSVHDDLSAGVAGGTANGLDHCCFAAQEALLVRIQNSDQRDLRNVQSLPQQVDSHQHIELAQTEIPNDLHALHRIHAVVQVPDTHAHAFQIGGQVLCHFLGQRCHQHTLVSGCPCLNLGEQIFDLPLHRLHKNLRIHQSCGADDLFYHLCGVLLFKRPRRGADVNCLMHVAVKLVEV